MHYPADRVRFSRRIAIAIGLCLATPSFGQTGAPDEAGAAQFDIAEYRVLGNTVLPPVEIERLLYPLLGPAKRLSDVEAARTALEQLYHDDGYGTVYVDIPPQKVADGIVRLRVTEGRIERSEISGARYFSEGEIKNRLPAANSGTVLKIPDLQKQLDAVNRESADRSLVPVLKAGSAPGTVDVFLRVQDQLPLHGSLELNNQATIDTKPLRAVLSLSYGNLFDQLDSVSFQYQATPQQLDQVRVIAANYTMHPLAWGLQPSLFYINSNSNVATVGDIGVLGQGQIIGTRLAWPLATSATSAQSLTFGLDYKEFRNTVNENGGTGLVTPINYFNLSLSYAGSWRLEKWLTNANLSANAGPRGFANNAELFASDRYKGRSNYFYLRGDLSTEIPLPKGVRLRLHAAGQGATEPTISNENYSIAGVDGVRGYLESEELGDAAIKGTFQLYSPDFTRHGFAFGDMFLFTDAGRLDVIDALPGQPGHVVLRSWGAGMDLLPGQRVTGSFTWAKALNDASTTRAGESRYLFVLHGGF